MAYLTKAPCHNTVLVHHIQSLHRTHTNIPFFRKGCLNQRNIPQFYYMVKICRFGVQLFLRELQERFIAPWAHISRNSRRLSAITMTILALRLRNSFLWLSINDPLLSNTRAGHLKVLNVQVWVQEFFVSLGFWFLLFTVTMCAKAWDIYPEWLGVHPESIPCDIFDSYYQPAWPRTSVVWLYGQVACFTRYWPCL